MRFPERGWHARGPYQWWPRYQLMAREIMQPRNILLCSSTVSKLNAWTSFFLVILVFFSHYNPSNYTNFRIFCLISKKKFLSILVEKFENMCKKMFWSLERKNITIPYRTHYLIFFFCSFECKNMFSCISWYFYAERNVRFNSCQNNCRNEQLTGACQLLTCLQWACPPFL